MTCQNFNVESLRITNNMEVSTSFENVFQSIHNQFSLLRLSLEGSLCQKDLEKLRTWKLDANLDKHKHKDLTAQGKKDLLSLGARFKDYFPELLQSYPLDSSRQKYKVSLSTCTHFDDDYSIRFRFYPYSLDRQIQSEL